MIKPGNSTGDDLFFNKLPKDKLKLSLDNDSEYLPGGFTKIFFQFLYLIKSGTLFHILVTMSKEFSR